MDFTEGGSLLYGMKCEDPQQTDWFGKYSWGKSTYTRINPENSFAYTDEFTDENGTPTPGMPSMDIEVALYDENGSTRMVSTTTFSSPETLKQILDMGMKEGLVQTWDRLEEFVA